MDRQGDELIDPYLNQADPVHAPAQQLQLNPYPHPHITHLHIQNHSIKPLAHLMLATGVIGYTVEWFALGRELFYVFIYCLAG